MLVKVRSVFCRFFDLGFWRGGGGWGWVSPVYHLNVILPLFTGLKNFLKLHD